MIERLVEACAARRWTVFAIVAGLAAWSAVVIPQTTLDAVPDLSDPQVILFTEWMGRGPDLVEDQITYPLVTALESTPRVRTVRGYSMFGMSFVYVLFESGTEIYWARTRVNEQLDRVRALLPAEATPVLGPDATGVGWVYQYALVDESGDLDLAEVRALQDFTIRPAIQSVAGVAEVASFGGFERQYQIVLDPNRLVAFGLDVSDVRRAVGDANSEVGARVVERSGREYVLRGRGYVEDLEDLEASVVALGPGGTPVRVRDVSTVQFGPEIRRGAADLNGRGEVVGGIVVMRVGSNALEVIDAVEEEVGELSLPAGVRVVPTYDRSELIVGSVDTLTHTLIQEGIVVALVCLLFLFNLRSALVAIVTIPLAVLFTFLPIHYFGMTVNIMSLAGVAIAVGELEDASTTFAENAARKLAALGPGGDRRGAILASIREVARPTFYSLLLVTVSFIPILALTGEAGRMFRPLALTHTFATFAAAILSVTFVPPFMVLVMRGRFRSEAENPVARLLRRAYDPVARFAVRARAIVIAAALLLFALTVPVALRLGSEFMPPLDEGALLVMPTTFAGISIEEARRALAHQDQVIMGFDEVASVHGKVGRAETATDPAQLDMIESTITLRPRDEWPARRVDRWYSPWAPPWLAAVLRPIWPDRRARSLDELASDIERAVRTPGYQTAVAPPIRTRIDMLLTGVRTPVGVKVSGPDLSEIERLGIELEGMLRDVPGTRSTFADRQSGREYIDVVPDRDAIARYGLTVRDVHDVLEAAVGGLPVSTVIRGRSRFSINLRYGADFRADPEALRALLVPVDATEPIAEPDVGAAGRGSAPVSSTAMQATSGGGAMGGGMPSPTAAGGATGGTAVAGMAPGEEVDPIERYRPPRPAVPLGMLAEVRVVTGPPMIKDEDGVLVGYVYADIDLAERDLGGWVEDAKRLVAARVDVPPGYRLTWTGQYEALEEMLARMAWIVPTALLLIVVLLRFGMRGWAQTGLVLSALPFALTGSVWLLWAQSYNVSTAVWVGLIAVLGTAVETGILMVEFLDQAIDRRLADGATLRPEDVDAAVIEGATTRVRPLVMSVASTVLGLLPLLWEAGPGADVAARIAAPVIGGLVSCLALTLVVLPAAYVVWRRRQLRRGGLASPRGRSA